ncbi:MAG TPA: hypothetical protein VM073_06200 [Usitatibacter sp.]|nr:hypothetical protein [Usitatibacter sp.]
MTAIQDAEAAIHELEARLAQLNAEIRSYPQPIARCDVQLAALIDQRVELSRALSALRARV